MLPITFGRKLVTLALGQQNRDPGRHRRPEGAPPPDALIAALKQRDGSDPADPRAVRQP